MVTCSVRNLHRKAQSEMIRVKICITSEYHSNLLPPRFPTTGVKLDLVN